MSAPPLPTPNRLELKAGEHGAFVYARHFDDVMAPAWRALLDTSPRTVGDVVVVTGGAERHRGGCHPNGRALDVRIGSAGATLPGTVVARAGRTWEEEVARWAERLRRALGPDFQAVVEADHLHLEHDPAAR